MYLVKVLFLALPTTQFSKFYSGKSWSEKPDYEELSARSSKILHTFLSSMVQWNSQRTKKPNFMVQNPGRCKYFISLGSPVTFRYNLHVSRCHLGIYHSLVVIVVFEIYSLYTFRLIIHDSNSYMNFIWIQQW